METQRKLSQSLLGVTLVSLLILLVPWVAMMLTDEVNWSPSDFLIMGILLFSTGISYVLVTRYMNPIVHRIAFGFALGITLFLIWANLAVGLIGTGPNPGNLMYIGVIAVGVVGTVLSRFTVRGMERTMYAMAVALVLVALIALLTHMQHYPGSSVAEILGVNAFFFTLFAVSGLLFRYAAGGTITAN